jgi:hypothetical protein
MARLDWQPRLSAALWTSEDDQLVERAIFENLLRIVTAYHMLEQGGVLLHSAAVVDDAARTVFASPSGAEQIDDFPSWLRGRRSVLSDDMNALRTEANAVVVEKLPFAGDFGSTLNPAERFFPVCDLYRLEKGPVPAIRTLPPASAIAALLECAPFVNRNPFRYEALIDNLENLHARLPVRVLTFPRDERTWEYLGSSHVR